MDYKCKTYRYKNKIPNITEIAEIITPQDLTNLTSIIKINTKRTVLSILFDCPNFNVNTLLTLKSDYNCHDFLMNIYWLAYEQNRSELYNLNQKYYKENMDKAINEIKTWQKIIHNNYKEDTFQKLVNKQFFMYCANYFCRFNDNEYMKDLFDIVEPYLKKKNDNIYFILRNDFL